MHEPITIVVAEDHQIIRRGLVMVLERYPDLKVVGQAGDGHDAVAKCEQLQPNIVLMDIGLPLMTGIEAAKEVRVKSLNTHIIVLTSQGQDETVFAALAAGADGYCLKDISSAQLYLAIMSVAGGASWLDPAIARRVLHASVIIPKKKVPLLFPLTAREHDVLLGIVDGLTNQQIGSRLGISFETVKTHIRGVMDKLSVSDRTQAAVKAVKDGLVD